MSKLVRWIAPWLLLPRFQGLPASEPLTSMMTVPKNDPIILSVANRCVDPDGFPRSGVLAGMRHGNEFRYSLPGPVISRNKGDRFLVHAYNELTDKSMLTGTTIHWHGITQNHSSQMDGVAYVTQCPISPGSSFLYNFTTGDQVGTFWYHSHYGVQYCDGLRGALIIRDPHDPYKHMYDVDDDSTVISLMDWYHFPSPEAPREVYPDSVLINGIGCHPDMPCRHPYANITVEHKKRYRFRLLNMACKPYYNFTIVNHSLTVIEVDGEYVEPYVVDSIQIHPAQRYSFVLNADQPIDNYWIDATPPAIYSTNATTHAVLRYIGAPKTDPTKNGATPQKYLNETELRSLAELPPALLQSDPDLKLDIVMYRSAETGYNFEINNAQYTPPSVPVLLQIMSGTLSSELDPVHSVYLLPRDKVVELTFHIDNTPGVPHPFHLHGHHFAVIKSADSQWRNYDRPLMRDTVSTGFDASSDNVTIRFITDNPGPWFLHCHINWHSESGMAIVFVEDYDSIRADAPTGTNLSCPYYPHETFSPPPPRSSLGPYQPSTTSTCKPDLY